MRHLYKKIVAIVLSLSFVFACACRPETSLRKEPEVKQKVTIEVNTMYGGDEYGKVFYDAVKEWEKETGYSVSLSSSTSDEAYKNRILMDFQTGAEPDVLFYFNGVDSNPLVANKRVISLDEIRKVYPEYAINMKVGMMKPSSYDGKIYAVPVNGYWEALYVNLTVLTKLGLKVPDENTTWDEFMDMCEKIKQGGKTPIAASLAEIPHYWFEYCIYNHQTPESHAVVPEFLVDNMAQAWVAGLYDIKDMYDKGYFPENTLYISDEESKAMFLSNEAAFLLEGSWYASTVNERANSANYVVTYVPGTETRKSTDIISGLSTGYYITKKAWDDEEKREAAVRFVEYMTANEIVSKLSKINATALKSGAEVDEDLSSFMESALNMVEGATGYSEAVQDFVPGNCRAPIFENMQGLMQGTSSIEDAVREVISLKKQKDE